MNRWMADSYAQMEEARGKGEDVVLPYWPFEKDLLFGFAREFVTSEYRENWKNTSLAKCMGLSSVVQSDKRCSYLADTPQMRLEGTSYDAPGYVTRTEFRLSPQPERAQGQETLYLHVAYPDTLGHSLTPKKL